MSFELREASKKVCDSGQNNNEQIPTPLSDGRITGAKMDDRPSPSPSAIQYSLQPDTESPGHERSQSPPLDDGDDHGESSNTANGQGDRHITMSTPSPGRFRPSLPDRFSAREQSSRSISEAVRLAMSREEQEQLLGDDEQADDDGCYPPRKDSIPWQPNPHRQLPIYTTIHRIRRLVIACIGTSFSTSAMQPRIDGLQMIHTVLNNSRVRA